MDSKKTDELERTNEMVSHIEPEIKESQGLLSSISPEDLEAQKDEMMVLESILGSENFIVYEGAMLSGKILIDLNLSEDFEIFETEKDCVRKVPFIKIKHLPPLTLHFTLPNNYPSKEKPLFTLSSVWLNRDFLSKLCSQLDTIWDSNEGMEIIFQWTTFLKENAMEFLKIDNAYDTTASNFTTHSKSARFLRPRMHLSEKVDDTPEKVDETSEKVDETPDMEATSIAGQLECQVFTGWTSNKTEEIDKVITVPSAGGESLRATKVEDQTGACESLTAPIVKANSHADELPGTSNSSVKKRKRPSLTTLPVAQSRNNFDRRAVFDTRGASIEPGSVMKYLTEYDYDEQEREFSRSSHSCDVCLTDKMGSEFLRLKCSHAFCKECIHAGYTTHIKEGAVDNIRCLAHKCTEVPSIAQVRAAVGEELFQRYDEILLQRALEKMGDLIYCPRTQCMKPVIRDPNDTLASCLSCGYKFCCVCKMVYHGVEPCRFKSEERKRLFEEYVKASKEDKLALEKMYGSKQIKLLVDTTLSEKWVEKQSKPCPHCKVPIEKFEGCNKVTCLKCSSFFCWICLTQLDRSNPYHHYNDPMSNCFNNLFENPHEDEGASDDDDEDEDEDEDDESEDDDSDFEYDANLQPPVWMEIWQGTRERGRGFERYLHHLEEQLRLLDLD